MERVETTRRMNLTERIEAKIKDIKFLKGAPMRDMRLVFALILFSTVAAVLSWVLLDAVVAERMHLNDANPTAQAIAKIGDGSIVLAITTFVMEFFAFFIDLFSMILRSLMR